MRVLFLIVAVLVTGFNVSSQQYHYTLRNYRAVDGLPQSQVRAILEDKNGYLWIGTEGGGLARFDGHSFKVYTTLDGLESNVVSNLTIDKHDNLWIVHPRGITKFDGSIFKKFRQPGDPQESALLRRIYSLGDTLFFLSNPGYVGKIHNDSVHYWSRPLVGDEKNKTARHVSFARELPTGELIFCLDLKTFYCRRGTESFMIEMEEQIDEHAVKIPFIYKGELWFQIGHEFKHVDLKQRKIIKKDLPVKNYVIYHDSLQNVFWTMRGQTFFKERIHKNEWKVDTVLRDTEVVNVLGDSEGNTWFGTDGNGLFKYFVQDFDRCASDKIRSVMSIYHDSHGATWIGTATRGLYRIEKGKVNEFYYEHEPQKNSVYSIAETTDGILYVGGTGGLAKYNRANDTFEWENTSDEPWRERIFNIQITPSNGMWLALPGQGIRYRERDSVHTINRESGLRSITPMAIYFSPRYDELFFGDEFGLGRIKNGKPTYVDVGSNNTSVIAIHPFRDSLLLLSTTGSGVIVYDPKNNEQKSITTKEGLASDFIYFTAPDKEGSLWIGSEKGITRIKVGADLSLKEHLHYDYENGLIGVETNQNAFCFFDDNKMFGLIDGVYIYNDPPILQKQIFPLHLTSVQLFYDDKAAQEYASGKEGFFNVPTNLSLPADKNHITFKFNRVDKRGRKSIKFKYLLQGFDKTWSQPSYGSEVTYSNLPPGEYTFLVLSSDQKGGWSGRPLRYDFEIRTPFYARTSFIIAMIILSASAIGLILFLRVRQRVRHVMMLQKIRIKEQETVRKDIARDFHDEMGNQLSRIINYVSLLKLNGHNASRNQDLYTKVEESAKYLYTGTRDFIWSIDPGNDELSKLFIHIRDFGEKLFEEKKMKFRAINLIKEQIKLPYGFSRQANLIFKEAMTNAFKYSHAENVTLSLKPFDHGFEMCLEDDGVGFPSNEKIEKEGGLKNIRERSERINAKINIESQPSRGTKVYIQYTETKKVQYGVTF